MSGRKLGQMRGVSSGRQQAIARDLVTVRLTLDKCSSCGHVYTVRRRPTKNEVAIRHGVTYEQVRTVERHLRLLAGHA